MYFNLSSSLHFQPDVIDHMKLYMAIIYIRRMKKAGYFGESKAGDSNDNKGTGQDFMKLFGN